MIGTWLRILVLLTLAAVIRPAMAADHVLAPDEIRAAVHRMAPGFGLDEALVLSVILAESDFVADAISPKNAIGLMQLMPDTAARFGVRDPFDPIQNLNGGMAYLRFLSNRYRGDLGLTLAAYNAGEGAVDQYGGIPPFAETQDYVARVRQYLAGGDAMTLRRFASRGPRLPVIYRPHVAGNWRWRGSGFTVERTRAGVLILRGSGPS